MPLPRSERGRTGSRPAWSEVLRGVADVYPYLAILLAAIVEGEVVFLGACVLVHAGRLDAGAVFAAAALGGSLGDQAYFYALRGRFRSWLDRFPRVAARRDLIVSRVQANATAMILACRFLPGLRVAIPAACAYAGVGGSRFTILSLLSSLAWSASVMGLVAWLGPASLAELGWQAWWTPLVPALLVLAAVIRTRRRRG
jgi:membrane-associated protein